MSEAPGAADAATADPTPTSTVVPPAMLGILGGGQLGRYFVMAARTMGYRTTVLEPDADAPAGKVADVHLVAAYDDPAALDQLAATCSVVTTEFENAPAAAMQRLAAHVPVHPSPTAIATCQDRLAEKQFLDGIGVAVAPYMAIITEQHLADAAGFTFPAILKTNRLGYDGKGQVRCTSHAELADAWQQLGGVACVLEQRMHLDRELSMVLARTADGRVACYPVSQNQHVHGILDVSYTPANLPGSGPEDAAELCTYIAESLGFVGVMAVEMFVVGRDVLVNELAPRPHNSGHYTLDACLTSQFEQQVRAVCGLALGTTKLVVPGVSMVNLMGDLWAEGEPHWRAALSQPNAHLHLYGKREPRPGRKMGHLTVTSGSPMGATSLARRIRKQLASG
ncbi:MAG: 5-(carboxyamino)imidazole ribonucleotide synthase [Actinomycetota bacterium]|nr:5-(carboxyamino)imidazole ribonucleotide synthase [Actinomycetota bacterium]